MSRRIVALAAVISVGALVASCSSPPAGSTDGRGANPTAKPESTGSAGTASRPEPVDTTSVPSSSAAPETADTTRAPSVTGFINSDRTGYAVGTFWRDFVDTKRGRTLKTLVHYPARGGRGATGSTPADGAFPVVLMAHGYRLPAAGYERILTTLTAAGYITVSPAFPGTSAETGTGNRSDITNQPADLSFVLDQIVALADAPGSQLPKVDHPDRVAAIGHSDGGLTISAFAYNRQFRDPRVAAAVVMTGGRALFPGSYFDGPDLPPLLAIHGTSDGNPYSASQSLVAEASARGLPAFLLTVENGPHIEPYMNDTAMPELADVVLGFLDVYVQGKPDGAERMRRRGNVDGKLRLSS